MGLKYPIRYEISPREVETGTHWITLELENVGEEDLYNLDVNLNSVDSYNLSVLGTGEFVAHLAQNVETFLNYQISSIRSTDVYITISGRRDDEYFYWESPLIRINVPGAIAEISPLFVLSHPYSMMGKTLEAEATIKGLSESIGLDLEFWVDTPTGEFKEIANIETKSLSPEEYMRYSAEFTPEEEGIYTVYAYLYQNGRLLDRETDMIWVEKE